MTATFTKKNYMILITGVILIVLGYFLMIGGGSEGPSVFNTAILDTQRITVAPIVCLLGVAAMVVAISWNDKSAVTPEI